MNEDLGSGGAGSLHPLGSKNCTARALRIHFQAEKYHMKYQVAVGISQHGFATGTSHLVSLATFCAGAAGSGDKGTAVGIVFLVSKMSFDVVSHRSSHLKAEEMLAG